MAEDWQGHYFCTAKELTAWIEELLTYEMQNGSLLRCLSDGGTADKPGGREFYFSALNVLILHYFTLCSSWTLRRAKGEERIMNKVKTADFLYSKTNCEKMVGFWTTIDLTKLPDSSADTNVYTSPSFWPVAFTIFTTRCHGSDRS